MSNSNILEAIIKLGADMDNNTKDLRINIEMSKNEIKTEMSEMMQKITEKLNIANEKIKKLEDTVENQSKRIDFLEKKLKDNNIILYGFEGNDVGSLFEDFKEFIENNLHISLEQNDINFIRRIGKSNNNTPRPVAVSFTSFIKKQEIMKKKCSLKGTEWFIKHDMTKAQREAKSKLLKKVQTLKEEGAKNVEIKFGKIFINKKPYNKNSKRFRSPSANSSGTDTESVVSIGDRKKVKTLRAVSSRTSSRIRKISTHSLDRGTIASATIK